MSVKAESTDHPPASALPPTRAGGFDRRGVLALAAVSTGALMTVLDGSIVTVALPSIQSDLGFSAAGVSWVMNGYLLAFGGLLLLAGRLGDLLGRKRMFLAGTVLFVAASLLAGAATSPSLLVAARFLQGIGSAAAAAVSLGILVTLFTEPGARGKALGVYSFTGAAGASLGQVLGGVLTVLALLILWAVQLAEHKWKRKKSARLMVAIEASSAMTVEEVTSLLALSVPSFLLATALSSWLADSFNWDPNGQGYATLAANPGLNLQQMLLPALVLGISIAPPVLQTTRASVLAIRAEDYVRTARAKGVPERRLQVRHILRNALIPVVTMSGLQFGFLLGGAIVAEEIFSVPGIGRQVLLGLGQKEYAVVQSTVLVIAAMFVLVNLVTDLLYRLVDPKVRVR